MATPTPVPTAPAFAATELQTSMAFEPSLHNAIWARFVAPFFDGAEPVCVSAPLTSSDQLREVIPRDLRLLEVSSDQNTAILIETVEWSAVIQHWQHSTSGSVSVRARTHEVAEAALTEVRSWFPEEETPESSVTVDFWQVSQRMFTTSRTIEADAWATVNHHYPPEVEADLASLMANPLENPEGRVILWHGPPGTGKTSAIRTLARQWSDIARFQIVLDPEPVFSSSTNLMAVILDAQDKADAKWRVLVIEDADDLVRAGNERTSQSLSRLLNVGDGIVGQGLKVLVLLTTNESPDRLHPALTRPGRCLAETSFRRFTKAEAAQRFPSAPTDAGVAELSLAEILTGRVTRDPDITPPGQYL